MKRGFLFRVIQRIAIISTAICGFIVSGAAQPVVADIELVSFEMPDTIALGCDVPMNITLRNNDSDPVLLSEYALKYFISNQEPPADPTVINQSNYNIPLAQMYLLPGQIVTYQRFLPVQNPLFTTENNVALQENVIITWGTGALLDPEKPNNYAIKKVYINTQSAIEYDLPPVPEEPDFYSIEFDDVPEEIEEFVNIFWEVDDEDSIDVFVQQYFSDIYFWLENTQENVWYNISANGEPLFEAPNPSFNGVIYLPNYIQFQLQQMGYDNINTGEIVVFQNILPLIAVSLNDSTTLYYDLHGEFGSESLDYLDEQYHQCMEEYEDYLEFIYGNLFDNATIDSIWIQSQSEDMCFGQSIIMLNNGATLEVDEYGDLVYYIPPSGIQNDISFEELPDYAAQYIQQNAPQLINEATFVVNNTLQCSVAIEAIVENEPVIAFDTNTETVVYDVLGDAHNDWATETGISPNPATEYIVLPQRFYTFAEICDINGKVRGIYNNTDNQQYIDVKELTAGIYFVKIYTESTSVYPLVYKFIKQ